MYSVIRFSISNGPLAPLHCTASAYDWIMCVLVLVCTPVDRKMGGSGTDPALMFKGAGASELLGQWSF